MLKMSLCLVMSALTLFFSGCTDKNSKEACTHQVTMDLDAGRYDAVLTSSCTDSLQRGAAYFGLAGFDTGDVINTFVRTGTTSGPTSTQSDLTLYLTSLISTVTETSLSYLDHSTREYDSIPALLDSYKDAQFYLSLVYTVKSLSLLKIISSDSAGLLDTACDINANTTADGADASSCALIAASTISSATASTCDHASYAPATPVDITIAGKNGIYSGLIVTLQGTGTTACPATFKKLLYRDESGHYWVAVAAPDQVCVGSDSNAWPCPLEQNGRPLDLVTAVDDSLNGSMNAVNSSLTSTSGEVQTSLHEVKTDACPGVTCTSLDIAQYLETVH
jgi:hypothetical protein